MPAGQTSASPQPAQSPALPAHAPQPSLVHAPQTTGHYQAHSAWPAPAHYQQQQAQAAPVAHYPQQQPLPASPVAPQAQPAAGQQGRPFARSGADVGFRVPVRMPRPAQPALAGRSQPASAAPQFVSVGAAAAVKAPAAKSAPADASGWPPALRAYVTRCLKTAMPDAQASARMHAALKQIISQADQAGERWRRDWDTQPTPSLAPPAPESSASSPGACVGLVAGTQESPRFQPRQEMPLPKCVPAVLAPLWQDCLSSGTLSVR